MYHKRVYINSWNRQTFPANILLMLRRSVFLHARSVVKQVQGRRSRDQHYHRNVLFLTIGARYASFTFFSMQVVSYLIK